MVLFAATSLDVITAKAERGHLQDSRDVLGVIVRLTGVSPLKRPFNKTFKGMNYLSANRFN